MVVVLACGEWWKVVLLLLFGRLWDRMFVLAPIAWLVMLEFVRVGCCWLVSWCGFE